LFSQAITCYLALSVPSCLDAQISLSDLEWSGGGGSEPLYRTFSEQLKWEVVELNVQINHVHLLVMIPPKSSVSKEFGIGLCRDGEGSNDDSNLQPISAFKT